jgi:hypothetical protein
VADDGNAYMCVVDGTTTPPEPWPGGGIAVNATVDASYWLVSAHGLLTNARVLGALANGYVKSTAGEPSTVALIPITDGGTGASSTAEARTNLGIGSVGVLDLNGNAATYLNGAGTWTTPSGVPSGSIIFFTTPCPAGYTRVAAWDGRYVRMGPSHTTGGAATHAHGPGSYASQGHTHPLGSLAVASHRHDSGTLGVASHTHSIGDHSHSFGATSGTSGSGISVSSGGFGPVSYASHTHSVTGTTGTGGGGSSGSASPDVAGDTGYTTPGLSGAMGSAGAAAITGSSDAQANAPLYVDFYACQKN